VKGREAILRVHIKDKPIGEDVDLEILAKRTLVLPEPIWPTWLMRKLY
jgi:ATP-dependent Zn protease